MAAPRDFSVDDYYDALTMPKKKNECAHPWPGRVHLARYMWLRAEYEVEYAPQPILRAWRHVNDGARACEIAGGEPPYSATRRQASRLRDLYKFHFGEETSESELQAWWHVRAEIDRGYGKFFIKTIRGRTREFRDPTVYVLALIVQMWAYDDSLAEPDFIRVIFAGKQLVPDERLSDSGVSDGSTVHFVGRLRGS